MIDYLSNFPPQIAVFLTSMLPIGELRASLVLVALGVYKMPIWQGYIWAILGNMTSVAILLWLLDPLSHFLMKHSRFFDNFFTRLFDKAQHKHNKKIEHWGALALILFVAIPLPFTGGWTGAVAASVFGIPFKKSFPLITIGIFIAGLIMALGAGGIVSLGLFNL